MNTTDNIASGSGPEETNSPSSLKILLADDTPMNLALATKMLKRRGHRVTTVENGKEAFEMFQKEAFDVILMDVQMPVMNGVEATQKIRNYEASGENESNHHTPIIAVTANDDRSDRDAYLEAGMNGVIIKPLQIKTLVSTILQIITQSPGKS